MSALPETPLERVDTGGRAVFMKREDLLPYGGGNKVPRFLHALARRTSERRVAALSDYGSHSFTVLTAMLRDPALGIDAIELWELPVAPDPYRRALARRYAETPGVHVRRGSTAGLLARWVWRGVARGSDTYRLGIGGTVSRSAASYEPTVRACVRQLEGAGADGAVVHVLPLASGDTARAVRAALRAAGRGQDHVAGVITGPWIGHAALTLRRPARLHLVKPRALDWEAYVAAARACHGQTGVWLDPEHTLPAWDTLARLPAAVRDMPVVFWVTCPRIQAPPFDT